MHSNVKTPVTLRDYKRVPGCCTHWVIDQSKVDIFIKSEVRCFLFIFQFLPLRILTMTK